ncbi:MAG: PA14 domain-containing protein [Pirellulaceae bacterium]
MAGGVTPGKWEMVDGKLEGRDGGVMLPVEVPQDYQLDLTVEHLMKDGFFVLGIVVAGHQTEIVVDWEIGGSRATGFHLLDGRAADNNESSYRGPIFQIGRPCHLRCIVRGNYVQFLADGKVIIQWRGDPARLMVSHDWSVPDRKSLFISSSWDFRISRIELTPYSSSPPAKRQPKFVLAPALRLPPPTGKDLQQARAAVRKLFAKEFAAINTVSARRRLSQTLLARVKEDRDDITVRFALLLEAQDLARNASDPSGACQAIEDQARTFELDALALQTAVVEGVAKEHTVKSAPVDLLATASTASIYLDKTLLAERLELAVHLAAVLKRVAVLERSTALKEYAARRVSEVTLAKQLFDEMSPLRGEIGEESKSAAANLAVGRYECFVRGNWPEGLLLLSRGSDKPLAEVAALELAADFRRYRAVADSWWKLSESAEEPWRTEYRQQAKYWYEKVSAELSALERQGKILNVKGVARNRLAAGLLGAYYQGDNRDILRTTRIEKRLYFPWGWGNGSPEATIPRDHFSTSWSGFIQAPIPGKYRLLIDSDDGSLLSLDGKPLWDGLSGGAGERNAIADLTGDPQRLEVQYHEGVATTHCVLRWGLIDGTGDQLVDETLLRHDPQVARDMRVKEVFGYYPDLVSVPSAPDGGLLAIFEDQTEFPTILTEGSGIGTMEGNDCYSGSVSLRIVDDQRFRSGIPDFRQRIREKPGPGEYRYLRLAWKKKGGKAIGLQILTQSKPGASDTLFEWRRYHIGPSPDVFPFGGASIRIGEVIPEEWSVITRDLFADYGEFDFTGIALAPCDGVYGLFDHIYLARRLEDFDRLGKERNSKGEE